ncbi:MULTISPECIES: hypothetical protein [unclassified Kitasatospora]|uniref:hypothetical protein n=1 Tax=unclassified Kitasatospora TaxID=2633591 RepID=UPI000709E395|nr:MULTISPECIES: hypothetical protein [unclassified Kitasatospora]KQV04422.1 hypothetical protein ASC99_13465 [Kitasatospora sp. Root107]KRB61047.1 hypothetical protein ASE03_12030 [Kitasatospora sp. Root187]
MTAEYGIESIRIVAPCGSGFAQIAHLSWAKPNNPGDASLYIRPFIGDSWSVKGAVAASVAADFSGEVHADRIHPNAVFGDAKLSLHHSGQTHVYVGKSTGSGARANRLPDVRGERLDLDAGGHVATVVCFDVAGLPLLGRSPSSVPPDVEYVVDGTWPSDAQLNLALYTGTDEQQMRAKFPFLAESPMLRFDRTGMSKPLFFGARARVDPRGGGPVPPGIIVVGGWGPGAAADTPVPMVAVWAGPDH